MPMTPIEYEISVRVFTLRCLRYVPQAGRVPALPVFLDSSLPPLPRSSVPEWTTTVRCEISVVVALSKGIGLTPMTLSGPINLMSLSVVVPLPLPWASVLKFPRSPTWRISSVGAPCVLLCGLTIVPLYQPMSRLMCLSKIHLQWGPADVQPLVLSPN